MKSSEIAKESPSSVEKFQSEGIAGGLYRIKAEGSFFFKKFNETKSNGFGRLNMHAGYFLIDRLFEVERVPDKNP